jgi:Aldos-2-ulose dehydratase, beta-propeller domain/FG-GAP-like repeat
MSGLRGKVAAPRFEPVLVEDGLKDGYWLDAVDINGDGRPDLIASGLALGEIVWYENPGWQKRAIHTLDKPVALDHADLTNSGRADLVVCHDYGDCMFKCKPGDGKISWMPNAAARNGSPWDLHPVAPLLATHRLRLGHFTRTDRLELMALPIVGAQGGMEAVHSPVRVMLYPVPDDPAASTGWQGTLVDEVSFRIIHDVQVGKFGAAQGTPLDSVLLASEEGVTWLHFADGQWQKVHIGNGVETEIEPTGFKGSGNAAPGRIGNDAYAYIATIEPFHGNVVAAYTKEPGPDIENRLGGDGIRWKRTILDVYGDPNERGEGPGHSVVCADFDGDGDDEFLVAMRGPEPWQGAFYYKAIDIENALFMKVRVSTASAARITVADFDGDGRPDFATTGYYTPGYFLCDQPRVLVFYNRMGR